VNRFQPWALGALVCALGVVSAAHHTASAQTAAPAPKPAATRAPAKMPDLQGIWQVLNAANVNLEAHSAGPDGPAGQSVVEGGTIPYQEWALKKRADNYANRRTLDTDAQCHHAGVPRATYLGLPFQIVQTPEMVAILYEYAHMTRRIYTNGTKHQEDVDFYNGDSRGRYEGGTLVVETTNFNDKTWFDRAGNFHSGAGLTVVERFSRRGADHLNYEATITDPKTFTRPWKIAMPLYRRIEPKAQILDYLCYTFEDRTKGLTVPLFRESPLQ
jgi:hypothetical protein